MYSDEIFRNCTVLFRPEKCFICLKKEKKTIYQTERNKNKTELNVTSEI